MKYAIKHRAIKKYRKNKSANINCIVLSFAAFSICDFLSAWFEADPNQYNYTISEPVCQFINCITVMFFGTAKCRANSRRFWSGRRRKKWCSCITNPRNRDVKRFRGWRLFPLNRSRRLARNIVTDSVDILDLVYNSYACLFKDVIRDSCKVGGHKVAGCNAS